MGPSDEIGIVILGAGFGGVAAARALMKRLPRDAKVSVTLIDQNNFFLFTPMLTEAAAGEIDTRHIVNPVRQLSRRVGFEQGRVDGLARNGSMWRVTLTRDGSDGAATRKTLEATHVVLALGSVPDFHHVEGVQEHALTMKCLGDAIILRNRVSALLERANDEPDPAVRRSLLTFVVAGGGFTGVETMAALNDDVRSSLRFYPSLRADDVRMLLVERTDRILPELGAGLASYAMRKLRKRGIELRLNTDVAGVSATEVRLSDGDTIEARTFIWAASLAPSPLIGALDMPKGEKGGILVDRCCAVPGQPGLWALGDCAEVPRGSHEKQGTYGQTAQNASREGVLVGRNIAAHLAGKEAEEFNYKPIGELAIVGRHRGVAEIYGLRFAGIPAWMLWRAIYLAKLPRFSKKVRVGLDWSLDLVFRRDISALPVTRGQVLNTSR